MCCIPVLWVGEGDSALRKHVVLRFKRGSIRLIWVQSATKCFKRATYNRPIGTERVEAGELTRGPEAGPGGGGT